MPTKQKQKSNETIMDHLTATNVFFISFAINKSFQIVMAINRERERERDDPWIQAEICFSSHFVYFIHILLYMYYEWSTIMDN